MTGTNSPNYYNKPILFVVGCACRKDFVVFASTMQCLTHHAYVVWLTDDVVLSGWLCRWPIAAGKRPVPFRTRKLSLRRADGTALGRVWESRLLPTLHNFMFGPVGCGFIVCAPVGATQGSQANRPNFYMSTR